MGEHTDRLNKHDEEIKHVYQSLVEQERRFEEHEKESQYQRAEQKQQHLRMSQAIEALRDKADERAGVLKETKNCVDQIHQGLCGFQGSGGGWVDDLKYLKREVQQSRTVMLAIQILIGIIVTAATVYAAFKAGG